MLTLRLVGRQRSVRVKSHAIFGLIRTSSDSSCIFGMTENLPKQRNLNPHMTFVGGRGERHLHGGLRSLLILAIFVPAHHAKGMAECSKTEDAQPV